MAKYHIIEALYVIVGSATSDLDPARCTQL